MPHAVCDVCAGGGPGTALGQKWAVLSAGATVVSSGTDDWVLPAARHGDTPHTDHHASHHHLCHRHLPDDHRGTDGCRKDDRIAAAAAGAVHAYGVSHGARSHHGARIPYVTGVSQTTQVSDGAYLPYLVRVHHPNHLLHRIRFPVSHQFGASRAQTTLRAHTTLRAQTDHATHTRRPTDVEADVRSLSFRTPNLLQRHVVHDM